DAEVPVAVAAVREPEPAGDPAAGLAGRPDAAGGFGPDGAGDRLRHPELAAARVVDAAGAAGAAGRAAAAAGAPPHAAGGRHRSVGAGRDPAAADPGDRGRPPDGRRVPDRVLSGEA